MKVLPDTLYPFVHLSRDFPRKCLYEFSDSLHEVSLPSNTKIGRAALIEKNLVLGFLGRNGLKNGPKISFFKFYEELTPKCFLIFCINVP